MNALEAIIFDMDGVITMTMPSHFRAWAKVFADEGICVSKLEVYKREGQKGLDSVLEIFPEYGKTITVKRAKELLEKKERLFKADTSVRFVPGARSFIKECRRKGIKMALVTGTARTEVIKILPKALIDCFDVIISGSDVKHGKPHPEPYQKALKALKIDRGGALVVENAPFGITSAVKAGIFCVAIETSLPRKYLKEADEIIHDYMGLKRILKRYKTHEKS
jgi:beta-phosphoglucomutase